MVFDFNQELRDKIPGSKHQISDIGMVASGASATRYCTPD